MHTRRILIVDDAPEFAHLVQDALATMSLPLETTIFLSGEEAWLEALRTRFDLVITDLRLPGISGTELVRRLRSRYPEIKIIAVSGLAEAGLTERTRAAGVDAFYRKPVEIPLLLTQIDNLLTEYDGDDKPANSILPPIRPSKQDTTPVTGVQDKSHSVSPTDLAAMHELERCVLQLMQESGAAGVALSSGSGHVLVGYGAATDYTPDAGLVETFSMLRSTLKKSDYSQGDANSSGLLAVPGLKNDLIVTSLDKFLFWLLFPTASPAVESGKAAAAWNKSKDNLHYLLNLVSPLPVPRSPHPPRNLDQRKKNAEPLVIEDMEMKKVDTGELSDKPIPKDEVDAYWASDDMGKKVGGISTDAISFDQASRLGILPKDAT
jgi:CheY-like chemotaxis protein